MFSTLHRQNRKGLRRRPPRHQGEVARARRVLHAGHHKDLPDVPEGQGHQGRAEDPQEGSGDQSGSVWGCLPGVFMSKIEFPTLLCKNCDESYGQFERWIVVEF